MIEINELEMGGILDRLDEMTLAVRALEIEVRQLREEDERNEKVKQALLDALKEARQRSAA